jgi:hypothetical protein
MDVSKLRVDGVTVYGNNAYSGWPCCQYRFAKTSTGASMTAVAATKMRATLGDTQ